MKRKRRTLNQLDLRLRLLGMEYSISALDSVLQPLGKAISSAGDSLAEEELKGLDPSYVDGLVDEATWIIENLLGASFIVCQTHITLVVSYVKELHEHMSKLGEKSFSCCRASKPSITNLGSQVVRDSGFTAVQVIDASANYFKHRSEWNIFWSGLDGNQQRVADVLCSIGASPGSTGNLRLVSSVLGNNQYNDHSVFSTIVMGWHKAVEKAHRDELNTRGLI